jgi:twitching motility protein PilT
MPKIDPILTALISNRADSVRLADGDIAHIIKGGAQHPLTRQPLGAGQLLLLLKEMAPPEFASRLGGSEAIEFTYSNSAGHFIARVSQQDGKLGALVSPAPNGSTNGAAPAAQNESPPATSTSPASAAQVKPAPPAAPAPPPVSAAPAVQYVQVAASRPERVIDAASRADMDSLLRLLVEKEGSDLHLRVGEPPILRVHGELVRLDDRPGMQAAQLESMITSVMPDRNFDEYAATNDTDFAHEIEDLARFRANAFRDHYGAGAVLRVIPQKVATVEALGVTQ